ncbi:cAMP-dependent protein kinase subunit [Aphanomyces cochlioides]|nr:cAMP-dependent protein kinase subunit [Aphanomyces cochlioides]
MPARPRPCLPLSPGRLKIHDNTFMTSSSSLADDPLALIVINGIGLVSSFDHLWKNAKITVCADGGANKLYDYIQKDSTTRTYVPQYVKGDLDSIRPDVASYFETLGTQVIKDPDQDSNDLDKCLSLLQNLQEDVKATEASNTPAKLNVLVVGAMGGRFDQEMQNINALFQWSSIFDRMTLVSDSTSATLLVPGKHSIRPNFTVEGRTCGLIPIGGPCKSLTTNGLKWNLTNHETFFGGLVSTSNHVLGDEVLVETSDPLVWTTELKAEE